MRAYVVLALVLLAGCVVDEEEASQTPPPFDGEGPAEPGSPVGVPPGCDAVG